MVDKFIRALSIRASDTTKMAASGAQGRARAISGDEQAEDGVEIGGGSAENRPQKRQAVEELEEQMETEQSAEAPQEQAATELGVDGASGETGGGREGKRRKRYGRQGVVGGEARDCMRKWRVTG